MKVAVKQLALPPLILVLLLQTSVAVRDAYRTYNTSLQTLPGVESQSDLRTSVAAQTIDVNIVTETCVEVDGAVDNPIGDQRRGIDHYFNEILLLTSYGVDHALDRVPVLTEPCTLEISIACIINGTSSAAGQRCDTPSIGIEKCKDRPLQLTMLYNGGDCSQSDNGQALKFTCVDFNGGPPVVVGETSFIVVTDGKGEGNTYYSGPVSVGSLYVVGDAVNRVESDMIITIFSSDQSMVQQVVQYHSSCSDGNLEIKNRFGSSQLVQYYNKLQGNVSYFVDFSFNIRIYIPPTVGVASVALKTLTAVTNFAGQINLTDHILDHVAFPGGPVTVTFQEIIDASRRRMHVLFLAIAGATVEGKICSGESTLSFEAGNKLEMQLPKAPTPTIRPSPRPTWHPKTYRTKN